MLQSSAVLLSSSQSLTWRRRRGCSKYEQQQQERPDAPIASGGQPCTTDISGEEEVCAVSCIAGTLDNLYCLKNTPLQEAGVYLRPAFNTSFTVIIQHVSVGGYNRKTNVWNACGGPYCVHISLGWRCLLKLCEHALWELFGTLGWSFVASADIDRCR